MRDKRLIISTLVLLAISYQLSAISCFAATQVPVTAEANVAPEGQYAPVITVTDQTLREGEILEFEVLAADANPGDIVHLEITQGQPPWLSILSNTDGNPARMNVRAAPPSGAIGNYRVYFKATDNSTYNMSSTKDIYITVSPANHAPVITAQNQTVLVGNTLTFTVNCQDPDSGDTVTLTYSGKPNWLNASYQSPVVGNPIDIIFTGTPQASDENTYTMTFNAVDNGTPQQSASKQITITVNRFNNPPVLAPIRNKEVPTRVKLEFTISATDQDSDTLTYSATGLPSGATFTPSTRKFTWTARTDQVGNYNVHFEVSDSRAIDSEDITISVTSDDAPVFDPLFDKYIKVGKTLSFAVIARDPNNDPLTYSASNLPAGATFNASTHTFTWTPTIADGPTLPDQVREYRDVMFQVTDGSYTVTKGIWIFVRHTDAPDLDYPGDKYISVGQLLSFTINATDPNGDALTYSVSNNPPGSSLLGQTFSWTPTLSQVGTYRDIMFTVTDSTGLKDTKGIWIFVQPSSAPIIEHIGDKTIVEGRTLLFTVNATGSGSLTYSAANLPVGAEFNSSTHSFSWTPAIGQAGVYRDVRFSVSDGVNTVNEDIWIFVTANEAPVVEPLSDKYVKADKLLEFGISAYDPDGDPLTYRALNLPSGATFDPVTRTFNWTPNGNQVGTYKDVMFEISDGTNIVTKGIWIFVSASGAPVLDYPGDKYVTIGETLTFTVNATDPDVGDTLTYSASNLPTGAFFNPSTRTFNWTPTAPQLGPHRDVMFHVTDGTYTDTKGIWIFVKSAGAPAISVPGDQRVRTGSLLEFTITATDLDTPPSGLTYSASNLPPDATFSNQVFRWTPTSEQIGTYPDVTFTVSDGANTDSKGIWIFVTAAGAPEFDQDVTDKHGRVGEPMIFSIPPAIDPDNAPNELTYYAINLPPSATFTDRTFRWTPQPGQAGTYKDVRLEVKDPDNNIDSDSFWIFIEENSPPILAGIGTKYGTAGHPMTFTISANDPDIGDHLTFTAFYLLPAGATFVDNGNRTATFNWANPVAGTYSGVHFEVSDGAFTDSENITIEVSL